jgi:hypothetical protein
MKSTNGPSKPIQNAIADSAKDRTSRLAQSLVWLRERALLEDIGELKVAHLNRYLLATQHPPFKKVFRAVAVICSSLVANELGDVPSTAPTDYTLVVMTVPDLRNIYMAMFESVQNSVAGGSGS